MFEHRTDPLLPTHRFFWRVFGFVGLSAVVVGVALGIGVLGYHSFGGLPWIDALVNASMIHPSTHRPAMIMHRSGSESWAQK